MTAPNNTYKSRSSISQALAILEDEGVYLGDNSIDCFMLEEQEMQQMLHQKDRQRSPYQLKSSSSSSRRRRNPYKQVVSEPNLNFNSKPILAHVIPYSKYENEDSSSVSSSKTSVSASSRSLSSSSSSTSSSSSSLSLNHPDDSNREVGGKVKKSRTSRKVRSRRKLPKAEENNTTKHNNNNNNITTSKSVKFSNYDHTVLIPHIRDFTSEEIEKCWMNEHDYRSIRSRSIALIEMMEDEKKYPISADYMIVNKHLVCVRGLGDKTSQCTRDFERAQRKLLYKDLFRVQEEQLREQGVVDPEALRKASTKYSKKSIKIARFVGISDEYLYNL